MATPLELAAMRRAIAISAQGLGSTSPNPPVGCVILDSDGIPVGEGYHVRKGEPHAEVNALTAAGERAEGGTAVVTLEPCNHYGRTPPCREELINAKVSRVLIAVMDPTSRGAGGATVLRQTGIEVNRGVLTDEALLVLGPWLASLHNGRPFITWTYQATLSGHQETHSTSSATPESDDELRVSHDLVIHPDGKIEEGAPGRHGADVFQVPGEPLSPNTVEALHALSSTGARSVLIEGDSSQAATFLRSDVIDQVIAYIPDTPPSCTPGTAAGHIRTGVPDGFRLTQVARQGGYVRLTAQRSDRSLSGTNEG